MAINKGSLEKIKLGIEIDISSFEHQIEVATKKLDGLGKDRKGRKKVLKDIDEMENKLNSLKGKLNGINEALSNNTRGATKFSTRLKNMIKFIPIGITIAQTFMAIQQAIIGAFKSNVEFNKSLAKMNTLFGGSKKEILTTKKALRDISVETGIAASELAEAGYQALSSGVSKNQMTDVVKVSAKLAKAGFTDVATSVDMLTSVMNTYGKSAGSVIEISDKLIATQNEGKITVDQMLNSLGPLLTTTKSLGIDFNEVTGTLAALTKNGVTASKAGTSLSSMFLELNKNTSQAGIYFKEISSKSFGEFIKEGGTVREAMQLLRDKSNEANISLAQVFTNKKSITAVTSLAGNLDTFNKSVKTIGTSAGSTEKAFSTATDELTSSWNKFTSSFERKMRKPMDILAKFTTGILNALTLTTDDDAINAMSKKYIGLAAAIRYKHLSPEDEKAAFDDLQARKLRDEKAYYAEKEALEKNYSLNALQFFRARVKETGNMYMSLIETQEKFEKGGNLLKENKNGLTGTGGLGKKGGSSGGSSSKTKTYKASDIEGVDPNYDEASELLAYNEKIAAIEDDKTIGDMERYNQEEQAKFDHQEKMKELALEALEDTIMKNDEEIASLREKGDLTAGEYKRLETLEKTKAKNMEKLAKIQAKKTKEADKKDYIQVKTNAQMKEDVISKSAQAGEDAIAALLVTKNASLSEMAGHFAKDIGMELAHQSAKLIIKGTGDVARGMAYSADPATPGAGAPLIAAGTNELIQGAAYGAGAALSSFIGDSLIGEESSAEDTEEAKREHSKKKDKDEEEKQKCEETVIHIERSNQSTKALLKDLNDMAMRQTGSSIFNSKVSFRK